MFSSERGEFGGSGSTDTDLSVPNRLVGHGELGEVVADHISLDLNRVPVLATIALNDAIAHFRNDDSVTQMGLDTLRLLSKRDILLGEAELLNEAIVLGRVAAFEASALSRVHHCGNITRGHLKELFELVASVNLLLERLLLRLCFGHLL